MPHDSRQRRRRELASLLAVLILAAIPLIPLLVAGAWPKGHESIRYFVVLEQFADAFSHGVLYPRWLPHLFGGYGYPTFCFYQPGFFYTALPFTWLPIDRMTAMALALYTLFATGGIGVYALCRTCARRSLSLGCAGLFLLTPYLYVNLYVRGDLSELAALLVVPWSMLAVARLDTLAASARPAAAWPAVLALALAAVVVLHPAVGMFTFGVTGAFAALCFVDHPQRGRFALPVLGGIAMALALSSPYWWSVFDLGPFVSLSRMSEGGYSAQRHTVVPWQFLTREWNFGGSKGYSTDDLMSFQLGAIHAGLALVGALLGRRQRFVRNAFFLYFAVVVTMTPAAAWMWEHIALARLAQYPWRLLSMTATLQVLCVAGFARALGGWPERTVGIVVIAVLAGTTAFHVAQFQAGFTFDPDAAVDEWNDQTRFLERKSFAAVDEFTPLTVSNVYRLTPRPPSDPAVRIARDGNGSAQALDGDTAHHIRYEVTVESATTAVIQQIYFPGWEVRLDGELLSRDVLEGALPAEGLIRIALPAAGTYTVEARYAGPPDSWWTTVAALIALAWILWTIIAAVRERRGDPQLSDVAADDNAAAMAKTFPES